MAIGIAVLELLEEEFHFLKSERGANHLLFSKLSFEIVMLRLTPLKLRRERIDSLSGLDCFYQIGLRFFVFFNLLFQHFDRTGIAFFGGQFGNFARQIINLFVCQHRKHAVHNKVFDVVFFDIFLRAAMVFALLMASVILMDFTCR